MKINTKISFVIGFMIVTMVVSLGISYAYFSINTAISGIGGIVTTDNLLDFDFEVSEYINGTNLFPINPAYIDNYGLVNTFTVNRKNGGNNLLIDINLDEISISPSLKSTEFKWQLWQNDFIINEGNFSNLGNNSTLKLNSESIPITTLNNFKIKIYILETAGEQNDLMGTSFSSKIKIITKKLN